MKLSLKQVAAGEHMRLCYAFLDLNIKAGMPGESALFTELTGGGYHAYFSPSAGAIATELIERYGGQPCERPRRSGPLGLGLATGYPEAWQLLD
ncbi:MAG TPA: hypothetical protein VJH03_14200 [Blastocatellia bacterium]|nr:hypothetical protein [Blastocatellia bacterium]